MIATAEPPGVLTTKQQRKGLSDDTENATDSRREIKTWEAS